MLNCVECGATFVPVQKHQKFCCASHRVKFCTKEKRKAALINASNANNEELERLRTENEVLKNRNETLKDSIKKHNDMIDRLSEVIDKRDDDIRNKTEEIERLRKERQVLMNRPQTKLNREHLNEILNAELRRQFPKDPEIQAHIGAIPAFNASYINALVTL